MQARVADTASPYERAQEVSDSVGSRRDREEGQTHKEKATQERKTRKRKHTYTAERNKVTIKQLENELEFWKKAIADNKRRYEEL